VGPALPSTYPGLTAAVQGHDVERDDFYPVADARQQEQQIRNESGVPLRSTVS